MGVAGCVCDDCRSGLPSCPCTQEATAAAGCGRRVPVLHDCGCCPGLGCRAVIVPHCNRPCGLQLAHLTGREQPCHAGCRPCNVPAVGESAPLPCGQPASTVLALHISRPIASGPTAPTCTILPTHTTRSWPHPNPTPCHAPSTGTLVLSAAHNLQAVVTQKGAHLRCTSCHCRLSAVTMGSISL